MRDKKRGATRRVKSGEEGVQREKKKKKGRDEKRKRGKGGASRHSIMAVRRMHTSSLLSSILPSIHVALVGSVRRHFTEGSPH